MEHLGTILTALLAVIAFSVQWGMVNAKLGQVEKRLDEFLLEARATRTAYTNLERRVAYLEGKNASKEQRQ